MRFGSSMEKTRRAVSEKMVRCDSIVPEGHIVCPMCEDSLTCDEYKEHLQNEADRLRADHEAQKKLPETRAYFVALGPDQKLDRWRRHLVSRMEGTNDVDVLMAASDDAAPIAAAQDSIIKAIVNGKRLGR